MASPTFASAAQPESVEVPPLPALPPGPSSPSRFSLRLRPKPAHGPVFPIRPANDRETSRSDGNGWSIESARQRDGFGYRRGSEIVPENTLKVETRVRIRVGTTPLQVSRRRAPPPWGLRSGSPDRAKRRHFQPGTRPACLIHSCISDARASPRVFSFTYRDRPVLPRGGGGSNSAPPKNTTFTETS